MTTVPDIYEPRSYRTFESGTKFVSFRVAVETSDLYIKAVKNLEAETRALIEDGRAQIKWAISRRREFLDSLLPIKAHDQDTDLVLSMIRAGAKASTGPIAAVAGAIAEYVGKGLLSDSPEIIVENGGDIFIRTSEPITVGLFSGKSPFSGKIGIVIQPSYLPVGVCTSSATVGPSLSLGRADAATVVSWDTALADAVATGLGNRVKKQSDLKPAVEWALSIQGVNGAVAILGDKLAALGEIEIVPIT
jgi:ApbE superfamily uncharacterized protein (UPF0280 family)